MPQNRKAVGIPFRTRWLTTFGLPAIGWRGRLRHAVRLRPFADADALAQMIAFLVEKLPAKIGTATEEYAQVADAFGWLCFQAWQSGSHFPAFAENYARFLMDGLRTRRINPAHQSIAAILGAPAAPDGACGFQRLVLADADAVRSSELSLQSGEFGPFLKAKVKYDEYAARLHAPGGFRRDWKQLCAAFPKETARPGILHRSLLPERHWVRDGGARFRTRAERFQAAFDLLCWKYCLWGVARGRPLLLKPSVVFTPHGTQVFIPAYLSFDAKRDLDFGLITKLHRARGIQRQGPGFSVSRTEAERLRDLAMVADKEARQHRLRGEKRYAYICARIGHLDRGDYRAIRKLLGRKT